MTDVLFYHLERQPLERVLPALVERTIARGWRAVIQAGSQERIEALDDLLWTYRDESFIPHGTSRDGHAEILAVYLTLGEENPNKAAVRFLVDGGDCADLASYERVVYLFDGHDEAAVAAARETWKRARGLGHEVTYWQQDERGQWQKKS
ncbi:MAG: DNA polymerase III subunit chi [Hyphomicrobiaceae bacterium]|nr:MAG: DNA polymerase III subunit chi [Hyphomicrobiaceae bacterium]